MSLLPRTLFWRNLLLIAALLVFAQTAGALAFIAFVTLPRLELLTEYARQHADAIASAARALPEPARSQYLATLDHAGPARVVQSDLSASDPGVRFDAVRPLTVVAFLRGLGERLPADDVIGWQASPRTIWIGVPGETRRIWVGLPAAGMLPSLGPSAAVSAAGSVLLALLGAYLLQRRIHRPMQALLGAARAVGAGTPPPGLDESGPTEIAALAKAFNAMTRDLEAQERQRALMLAGISHDLRTPLAKIRLALELIGPAAEPELRLSIERSVDNANHVIDQFIDFARADIEEAPHPTDLNALVADVIADIGAPDGQIRFEAGCLPVRPLRPRAMRRLMANLLDNALKYAGPPVLVRSAAEAGSVTLSVIDSGPGVAAADQDRLLRPFVRGSEARDGVLGAGLGLAIVQRIAGQHQGRVTLLPGAGDGARPGLEVRITLAMN